MKLLEREIGLEIELRENEVAVVVLEDIALRLSLIEELYLQLEGKEGNWLLSEKEKIYDLSKHIELILEPFSLQLNSKKLKTKLYQDIKVIADECFALPGLELHSYICTYLERVLEKVPYPMRYKNEWNLLDFLKSYNVELEEAYDDVCEKIFEYIKLMNQVCGINVFVTVNLKQYLTEKQLIELYKLSKYSKIQLVLIEFNMYNKKIEGEKIYILDKDDCIITY